MVAGAIDPLAEPGGGAAPRAQALSFVNILFDRPGTTARFGPNELVEIMAGNINFIGGKARVFGSGEYLPACTINAAGTGTREKPGIDDKVQPFADIYLVPSGREPRNNEPIVDVVGTANTVFGGTGGSFLYEPLGVTFPRGNISAGVYGIVVDECQNGVFDTGEDSYIDDAFWVDLDQDVPPISPAAIRFLALKSEAEKLSKQISGIEELLKFQEIMEKAKKLQEFATAVVSPETFSVFLINGAVSYIQESSPYAVVKKDLKETMNLTAKQHASRIKGLAADPPQTDFRRPAVPITVGAHFEDSQDPVTEAFARWMAHQDALSATSGALLDAIERYQGADQVGDAQWALRHARTIRELVPIHAELTGELAAATAALTGILGRQDFRFSTMVREIDNAVGRLAWEKDIFPAPVLSLQSEVLNTGADPDEVRGIRDRWDANDSDAVSGLPNNASQWVTTINSAQAALDAYADAFAGMDDLVDPNIPLLETELGDLDQDPQLDIAVAGTPAAGATVTLSVGPADPGATYDWDLDADGDFDDAIGASVDWTVPGDAMVGVPLMVSVRGTAARSLDSAIEVVIVGPGGNLAPAITSRTVNGGEPAIAQVAPGTTTTMSVTASDTADAIADTLTYTWMVNGEVVPGATSASFAFTTPPDRLGTFHVDVDVSDGQATTNSAFFVWSRGPDLDGDGYMGGPFGPDCLDDPALQGGNVFPLWANPAQNERVNGVDDNCNGLIDDIVPGYASATYPTTYTGIGFLDGTSSEGTLLRLRADRWSHPNWALPTETFRLTVDWDDGTPVDSRDVTYDPLVGAASVNPDFFHTYDDQLTDLRIEFCWEWLTDPTPDPVLGREKHCSAVMHDVVNDRPIVNATDFRTWGPTQRSTSNTGVVNGDWTDIDPFGKTLISVDNANNFVIRTSLDPLGVNGYGRVALNHEMLGNADDDEVGMLFGYDPDYDVDPAAGNGPEGEFADPDADVIGLTWMNPRGNSRYLLNPSTYCAGAPNVAIPGSVPNAFTLWRQHGRTNFGERQHLRTFDYPDSTDPTCSDDDGIDVLADVPGTVSTTGLITASRWRPHASDVVNSADFIDLTEPYLVEYDYQPRSITVWVNGVQQLRYNVPAGDDDLPPSRSSVVMISQAYANVNVSGATPVFEFEQGKGGEFDQFDAAGDPVVPDGITMPMHDGAADTHEARIDWGDGETTTAGTVSARPDEAGAPYTGHGWFTITGDHVYERAGTFDGNVCVTDDEGLSMCSPFVAEVANRAPRVNAGPDIAVGAEVSLSDITFQDPGPFDAPFTATIDWGDGTGVLAIDESDVSSDRGGGIVTASHSFTTDGETTVRVCVTDGLTPAGLTGCDERTLDVRIDDVAPIATLLVDDDVEGRPVDVGVGITDANVDETHTISVDWGDGSPVVDVPVGESLIGCTNLNGADFTDLDAECGLTATASPTHVYADNGSYLVGVEVCDSDGECASANQTLDVANVAPNVTLARPAVTDSAVRISGTYADPSPVDTHRLTVDWGDGTRSVADIAGGIITATHTFSDSTTAASIVVCVVDDDGGTGCVTTQANLDTTTPPPTPKVPFLVPLTPARLLDTRNSATIDGNFTNTGPLAGGQSIELKVTGRGGVPTTGVDAAVLNVGALTPTAGGFLTIHPCGTLPNASSLNYTTGVNIPNEVIAKLSPTGTICIYTYATTGLIADVVGYIPTGSDYQSLTPARLLDTRNSATIDGNFTNTGPLAGGQSIELKVTGRGGVPTTGVDAAVLNVGALTPTAGGFLTIHPCGTLPNASSLNYTTGVNIPNEVIAKLSPTGTICIYTYATTGLIADVVGYIPTGSDYQSLTPARLLDTRNSATIDGNFTNTGPLAGGQSIELKVTGRGGVPTTGVDAAVLNVGALTPTAGGFLTIHPCGTLPNASSLNYTTGVNIPNEVIAKLSPTGTICIYTYATTGLIADVVGYIPTT